MTWRTIIPTRVTRPPILYAAGFLLAAFIKTQRAHPIFFDAVVRPAAIAFLLVGLVLFVSCVRKFRHHRTTVSTHGRPSALIEAGPYRFSRNPIYVALTLLYLAGTFWTNNGWGLVLLVPVLIVMQKGVIEREETYLTERFGESYVAYTRRVRRWL